MAIIMNDEAENDAAAEALAAAEFDRVSKKIRPPEAVEKTPKTALEKARASASIVACFDKALSMLARAHPKDDHRELAKELLEDAHGRRERRAKLSG